MTGDEIKQHLRLRAPSAAFWAVVMGASAGGMEAITAVLSRLPETFGLPILVVQHLHPADGGCFAEHLDRKVAVLVREAHDKEKIQPGHVYLAPADYHMLVEQERTIALSVDDKVNWSRPSIDVLFESAAQVWRQGLIGVILSGANHDGAAGMSAIMDRGGMTVVQDPDTAAHPEMPKAAITGARVATVLPPASIGDLLCELGSHHQTRKPEQASDEMKNSGNLESVPEFEQKILIVDDREENLHALAKTLEEIDTEIIKARSGDEALRASLNHEFALAILDVKMPVMSGYELAEFLRSDEKTQNLPIIFLSAALLDEQDAFKGYESGAVDYITKPFNPLILLSKVRIFLELDRQREELNRQAALIHAANQELEAFSYSVSHDLRAPLRIIQGYASILLNEHLDQLDPTGQRFLNVIDSQVKKMDKLIGDLLAFSHLVRQPMAASKIMMDELAKDVFAELKLTAIDRELKVQVSELPPAYGDRSMIRQVFVNLLSNAIKFTRSKIPATIEIGCKLEGQGRTYYVKDNGVGFNMQYMDKLFKVFQRLHSTDEYEGTGVGLALVQRIIARHGGEVWAEGAVNEGATLYFTLPGQGGPSPRQP